jgi:hypothetical protein
MKYHLAHIVPSPRMHGLNGYKDVIDTLQWGLGQLGHEVTYATNEISGEATNIIFGAQMIPAATLRQLPADTIVYQLEQLRENTKPDYLYALQTFDVWDYSKSNIEFLRKLGPANDVKWVPVGYAPILERVERLEVQDIDVLMYGIAGQERLAAVYALSQSGLVTVFVSGLYGAARDALIARAKLVVNVTLYRRVFEIVRVSYLLANKKAVVAVVDASADARDEFGGAIQFSDAETLVRDCEALVRDDRSRHALEGSGYQFFRERNIRDILSQALAA